MITIECPTADPGADAIEAAKLFRLDAALSDWTATGPDMIEKSVCRAALPLELSDRCLDATSWLAETIDQAGGRDIAETDRALAECGGANEATAAYDPDGCGFRAWLLRWIAAREADRRAYAAGLAAARQALGESSTQLPPSRVNDALLAPQAGHGALQRSPALPAYARNDRGQNTLIAPKRSASLRLLTPSDCAVSPPRGYIVKGLIAPRDLALMVAKPGGGKSALAPAIGYAIAQGQPVFGRRTKPGLVLYVPVEDPHGMRQRVHALKLTHGDTSDFLVVEGVSDLFSADSPDPAALLEVTRDNGPALVVIDTLAAAWRGMEEIEGEDMARVLAFCRALNETGCAVLLLCHPSKAAVSDGTPRGHSSLPAEADVSLSLEWLPDGKAIGVRLTKNRNGPAYGDDMAFTIKGKRVGTDEDGDAIFAPVAHELADGEQLPPEVTAAILAGIAAGSPDGRPWSARLSTEARSVKSLLIAHGIKP